MTRQEAEEPEINVDLAALVALQSGQRFVFGELDGVTITAERTSSGGLVVNASQNGTQEPFAIFDAEELEELQGAVDHEIAELEEAKTRGELRGDDVSVMLRFHRHKRRKCRPTGIKTDCRVRRCGNDGKNIDHLKCSGLFGRYFCWCRR